MIKFKTIAKALCISAALTLPMSAKVAQAEEKSEFSVCWSIYVGWMPWGYLQDSGIMKKWADKYEISVDIVQRLQVRSGVTAKIHLRPAHSEYGCARRAPLVEHKDLSAFIAGPLHRQERQQDGFPRAGRSDDQCVSNVADMQIKPERRCAFSLGRDQGGASQVHILGVASPDRRDRDHVREVKCMQDWLAHISVDMAGKRAEPGLNGVERFSDGGKAASIYDALCSAQVLVNNGRVAVHDRNRRGDIAIGDQVRAKLLQRGVGVSGLVVSVAVEQGGLFIEQGFTQDRAN